MATGWAEATANAILAAVFQATGYSVAGLWVQLHTGDPGADGTANVATNDTRADASAAFGTAPLGGVIVNDGTIGTTEWAAVPASETYTHATLWDDPLTGAFVGSGELASASVTSGNPFALNAGDLTATLPIAA